MSYTPCPVCGGMLEGDAESPCVNATCINSSRGRSMRDPRSGAITVDHAAALSELPGKPPAPAGPNRKARREAIKAAKAAARRRRPR